MPALITELVKNVEALLDEQSDLENLEWGRYFRRWEQRVTYCQEFLFSMKIREGK